MTLAPTSRSKNGADIWKKRISALIDLEFQYKSQVNQHLRNVLGSCYWIALEKNLGFAISEGNSELAEYFRNKMRDFHSD